MNNHNLQEISEENKAPDFLITYLIQKKFDTIFIEAIWHWHIVMTTLAKQYTHFLFKRHFQPKRGLLFLPRL